MSHTPITIPELEKRIAYLNTKFGDNSKNRSLLRKIKVLNSMIINIKNPRIKYDRVHLTKDGNPIKTFEQHAEHFILRLKERYDLDITFDEYNDLCKNKGDNYNPLYCRNSCKKIGYVYIHGIKVVVLNYRAKDKALNTMTCYSTCFPADSMDTMENIIRTCFGSQQPKILLIYKRYLEEKSLVEKNFETDREAHTYYHNTGLEFGREHFINYRSSVSGGNRYNGPNINIILLKTLDKIFIRENKGVYLQTAVS